MGCCQGYLFTLGQGYFYLTLSAANMRKKEDNYGHVDKETNKVTLENKTFFQNLFGVFDFFCSHLMVPVIPPKRICTYFKRILKPGGCPRREGKG